MPHISLCRQVTQPWFSLSPAGRIHQFVLNQRQRSACTASLCAAPNEEIL